VTQEGRIGEELITADGGIKARLPAWLRGCFNFSVPAKELKGGRTAASSRHGNRG
jgi:hypothetical protein